MADDTEKPEDFTFYWRLHRLLKPWVRVYARLEVAGDPFALETDRPYLLASNHSGHLWWDSLCLLAAFDERPVRVIAHHWDATVAPVRAFLEKANAVFLEADVEDIMPESPAVGMLRAGSVGLIYPEESYRTFRHRYVVHRFSPHAVRYAQLAQVPIVPVAVIGAEEAAPCLFGLKKKGVPLHFSPPLPPILPLKVTLEFGRPVTVAELAADAGVEVADREGWQACADRLQAEMLALIKKHRPERAGASDVSYIDVEGWI